MVSAILQSRKSRTCSLHAPLAPRTSLVVLLSPRCMHLCSGLPVSCRSHTQALSCAVKRHVYRNDKAGITRQRTRTGARSLRRCAYSQTGISAAREKKLRDAQARAAKLKSPVSSAKRFAHRAVSPPDPFDAFDQTLYRFRHHGMLRPALAKSGRAFVCASKINFTTKDTKRNHESRSVAREGVLQFDSCDFVFFVVFVVNLFFGGADATTHRPAFGHLRGPRVHIRPAALHFARAKT